MKKVRCYNNIVYQTDSDREFKLTLKIGNLYDFIDEDDFTVRIGGFTFAKDKTIRTKDDEGNFYTTETEWYWELYFERLRNKNLEELLD